MTRSIYDDPGPEAHWRAALADGRFLLQRGRDGRAFFPPRVAQPGNGSLDHQWIEASGGGAVYSVTVVAPRPPAVPYNVVLVDLDEGVRLMSRVEGLEPSAVAIGMRVRARVAHDEDGAILIFDPA